MAELTFQSIAGALPSIEGRIFVAYSGGVDSHVLLHLCAQPAAWRDKVTAVYVHHGLQAAADDWAVHCRQQAQALGVAFLQLNVDAHAQAGESPEAAAREARYRVLKPLMQSDDVLLLAQHREDQMETLLLQLFRGAGVAGLAAMPVCTPFGKGCMMRPLLAVSKAAILEYATEQQLDWVEDPTNQSSDIDRNFLRHQIVPLLKQRWPSLDKTVARSARHCGEAHTLLGAWARDAMNELIEPHDASLRLEKLTLFSDERSKHLLRIWLTDRGLKAPSEAVLDAIFHQLIAARDDADPSLVLQGFHLKRYRQRLVCLPSSALEPLQVACHWPADLERVSLGQGGQCWRRTAKQGIAQRIWQQSTITLRPRQGGEKLKLPGRTGRHALKKLYQEVAIPPWERSIRPLVYVDDRLAAVAGLWVDEWACGIDAEPCYHIDWGYADFI